MSLANSPKSRIFMDFRGFGIQNSPKYSKWALSPRGNCDFLLFARLIARSHRGFKCSFLLRLLQFCCGLLRIPFFPRNSSMGPSYEPRELAKIVDFHGFSWFWDTKIPLSTQTGTVPRGNCDFLEAHCSFPSRIQVLILALAALALLRIAQNTIFSAYLLDGTEL